MFDFENVHFHRTLLADLLEKSTESKVGNRDLILANGEILSFVLRYHTAINNIGWTKQRLQIGSESTITH
jgi:hypothetical protein